MYSDNVINIYTTCIAKIKYTIKYYFTIEKDPNCFNWENML